MKNLDLNHREKKVFGLHFSYSIIEGMLFGIFVLNEFVFIKSLNGSNVQLAVLFQFTVSVLLFSVLIQELIKRFSKRRILT
ncbi:MAG: hypothetical protein PF588_03445, partial [Candidatus Kapabacteria bacterium]|nr:hypothetical protein [Candidatus Kapabacteria bacterium]